MKVALLSVNQLRATKTELATLSARSGIGQASQAKLGEPVRILMGPITKLSVAIIIVIFYYENNFSKNINMPYKQKEFALICINYNTKSSSRGDQSPY